MKKAHYLLLATCFTTAVFANDEITEITSKANVLESPEFIDVMPKALENVDLSDPKMVVTTAINAFLDCEVDVSAYLTYISPDMYNPQKVREKTQKDMQQGCKKMQEMLLDKDVQAFNVDYNDDETEAQVSYQMNEKMKTTATLIKTPNGWRMK